LRAPKPTWCGNRRRNGGDARSKSQEILQILNVVGGVHILWPGARTGDRRRLVAKTSEKL